MARIKLFTVEQAEKALPLVRRIVDDIVRMVREGEGKAEARQKLPEHPVPGSNAEEQAFALERDVQQIEDEVRRCQKELEDIGVELKDYRLGLIDFYSRYEGRIVYLCWKAGEGETLGWWHGLESGFRGRQPLTPANRARFKGLEAGEKFAEIG